MDSALVNFEKWNNHAYEHANTNAHMLHTVLRATYITCYSRLTIESNRSPLACTTDRRNQAHVHTRWPASTWPSCQSFSPLYPHPLYSLYKLPTLFPTSSHSHFSIHFLYFFPSIPSPFSPLSLPIPSLSLPPLTFHSCLLFLLVSSLPIG